MNAAPGSRPLTQVQTEMLLLAADHEVVACSGGGAERVASRETRRVAFVSTADRPRVRAICNALASMGLLDEVPPSGDLVWVHRPDGAEWAATTYVITDAGRVAAAQLEGRP